MPKRVGRVKLVAELEPGVTTATEVARLERDEAAGADRLRRHVTGLLGYLERNRGELVPYAARRRRGQPISTAFVESAVNEIVAKRMT